MPTYVAVKRAFLRFIAGLLVLCAAVYVGDYLFLRLHIPPNRPEFGSVTVTPYFEIHEKNGKTEYDFQDPVAQTCVNSLFPHIGYEACWYLRRHPQLKTEI